MKKNHLPFEGVLDLMNSVPLNMWGEETQAWTFDLDDFLLTQFTVLKSDTLILISIWSLPASCLMLIAIRVTRAHTGDYLITLVLLVPINNPSRAIIHVAILINSIMWTAVKLDLDEVSSSSSLVHFLGIGSSLLSVVLKGGSLAAQILQSMISEIIKLALIWTTKAENETLVRLTGTNSCVQKF